MAEEEPQVGGWVTYQKLVLDKLDQHQVAIRKLNDSIVSMQTEILAAVNANERRIAMLEADSRRHDRMLEFFWQKILAVAIATAAAAVGVGAAILKAWL